MRWVASVASAFLLASCASSPTPAPSPAAEPYGWLRDPFPVADPPPQPPVAPALPPLSPQPDPPAQAPASNACGSVCGKCSRASEACDKEIRSTKARGPQCAVQEVACAALVAKKRSTSCKCPDDEDD